MKTLLITSLVFAGVCAPAMAREPSIEVLVPANIAEPAVAEAYKDELKNAINWVCRRAVGPAIGVAYYTLQSCIDETTEQVAAEEPTGLLAASLGKSKTVVLADQSVR